MACGTEENAGLLSRLGLNDNKAGMQNLDREKINQIIFEASKGSKYFENEKKKDKQVDIRIAEQRQKIDSLTEKEIQKAEKDADILLKTLEEQRDLSRTIVHIDMDAFFAAVETRDNPSLLNKPMAVGSTYMLSTSNYIARRFGVRAAMPGFIAKKLCPQLVIVPLNFSQYAAVSKEVKRILVKYDRHFSPMSFDEAYLDITEHLNLRKTLPKDKRTVICRTCDRLDPRYCYCDPNNSDLGSTENQDLKLVRDNEISSANPFSFQGQERADLTQAEGQDVKMCPVCKLEVPKYREEVFGVSAEEAVREIRRKIEQRTRLTASAGIAANTLLAKICSDKNKPNGQFNLPHITEVIKDFMTDLPIRKVCGIGKVTEKMLQAIDVVTCSQLYKHRALLYLLYSEISFNHFMCVTLGIGSTHVESDGERKSRSTEQTFFEMSEPAQLYDKCLELSKILASDLQEENLMGRTVTLKIKTIDFDAKTKSQSLTRHTSDEEQICNVATNLLKAEIQSSMPKPFRLRLMGVRMSSLIPSSQYPKRDSIEYFMKKESSTSDTILLTEHEKINTKEYQNTMTANHCGNSDDTSGECLGKSSGNSDNTSGEYLGKSISESPGHYCPICDRKCPKDLRLFNAHIDKCLLQQSGENDRKTKRTSPVISNEDYEDFLQFSTLKVTRKTKKKTKMTQKSLKTVFEEALAGNGIPTEFGIEKSSKCKFETLSETENVLKQREDCKNTCTEENSSGIELKGRRDSVVLETSVDFAILQGNLSSDGIVEGGEERCSDESKDLSLSSPVNKLLNNSEELLVSVSDCDKPTPRDPTTTTDISKVPEPNNSNMEQITSKPHNIKTESAEPDGTGLVKISPENMKNQHSKNSPKQAGCNNKERRTDCSSPDISDGGGVLRQIQTNKVSTNTPTKLKCSQNNKVLKKTSKNCNLLKYFSKSSVNSASTEDVNQCLDSSVSLKWSESTEVVVEETDRSVLDETICPQQQEVDVSGQLNSGYVTDQQQEVDVSGQLNSEYVTDQQQEVDVSGQLNSGYVTDQQQEVGVSGQLNSGYVTDQQQRVVKTSQGSNVLSDKLQRGVDSGQGISLASDKPEKGVETGQGISLASDKLDKEVKIGQGISLACDKPQKRVKTGQGISLARDKPHKEFEIGKGISLVSDKPQKRVKTGQGSSTDVTEQLQGVFDCGQLYSVASNQPQSHVSAYTVQTDCSISQLHSVKLFPYSTENSTKSSKAVIELDNSCNYGDGPNNANGSSCRLQPQGSTLKATGCVDVGPQIHTPLKTLRLPQDAGLPDEGDSCPLPSHNIEPQVQTPSKTSTLPQDTRLPIEGESRQLPSHNVDPQIQTPSKTSTLLQDTGLSAEGDSGPLPSHNIEPRIQTPSKTSTLPQDSQLPIEGDSGQLPSPEQTTELVHQCPICNNNIPVGDMSTFNEHVDLCLNQATIRKILVEQGEELKSYAAPKRPAEYTSPDVSKRKKFIKTDSTPRIDSYFFSV